MNFGKRIPMAFVRRSAACLALTAAVSAVVPSVAAPAPPANGELGFIVNHFGMTYEQNADDCPAGLANMLRDNFLDSLSEKERVRISAPENADEFKKRFALYARGPDDTDVCTHYDRFDHPPMLTVKGRKAQGFNLDDNADGESVAANICPHANFVGRSGEPGIDNQLWRAMGCLEKFRGVEGAPPDTATQFESSLANGENAQVLLLRGVDSLENDDHVEVVYANTRDRAILDFQGNFVPGASYSEGDTPGGPNVLTGRIVNGVLEAKARQIRLRQVYYLGRGLRDEDIRGTRTEWDLTGVRLHLEFQPDGSVSGMLGGYQPLWGTPLLGASLGGLGAAVGANYDCASMYQTIKLMADGDRDPETGQCRRISTAIRVSAVPAHVLIESEKE